MHNSHAFYRRQWDTAVLKWLFLKNQRQYKCLPYRLSSFSQMLLKQLTWRFSKFEAGKAVGSDLPSCTVYVQVDYPQCSNTQCSLRAVNQGCNQLCYGWDHLMLQEKKLIAVTLHCRHTEHNKYYTAICDISNVMATLKLSDSPVTDLLNLFFFFTNSGHCYRAEFPKLLCSLWDHDLTKIQGNSDKYYSD